MLASTGASPDIRYFGEPASQHRRRPLPQIARRHRGRAAQRPRRCGGAAARGKPDARALGHARHARLELAPYLAAWKRKVERVGTLNFPSAARSAGLSGSPVVEVEIAADGRSARRSVRRSSGHGALDQAALTILRLASPFDPFPAELAADTRACALPTSGTSSPACRLAADPRAVTASSTAS